MRTSAPEKVYMVFVLQARGDMETTLSKIRPKTVEATEAVRTRFAHLKASWQTAQSTGFQLKWQGRSRGEGNEGIDRPGQGHTV
jgi:hypothetical protein